MRLSLCNEVLRPWPFERQCGFAAALGWDGLEVAPFTLADDPTTLSDADLAQIRRTADDHGLAITGLHWLLLAPEGLAITDTDPAVVARTRAVLARLAEMGAALGGSVLVHGSPVQRRLPDDADGAARARDLAFDHLRRAAGAAAAAGVTWCLEPLSARETNFVTTVAEAVAVVEAIAEPGLATMVDTSAAAQMEAEPVADLLDRWLPTGHIRHIQLNDRNRRAPGEGEDRFAPVLAALARHGWDAPVAVEPFVYDPDGPACAARAVGYLRGIEEALA
ncbi:MAG: TIM barrel protein [Alphaproteobacteria bacterium]|jgi:sugar phosphate isomerase/epimerase|nr:TIM barrel protein [Alphaproteobacteria bacterium]